MEDEIEKLKEEIKKIKKTLQEHEDWIKDIENMMAESAGEAPAGPGKTPFAERGQLWQREVPPFVKGKDEKKK